MSEPVRPCFVHLLPALIPPGALKGGVSVVVDVLRATTVMVRALAAGAMAIVPCAEVDEARGVAAALPEGSAVLGGERQGLPIEGFDLGNSPDSYTEDVCRGRTVVMTTTNGTRAILASLDADRVLVASFGNLAATVRELKAQTRPVHIVCSGTNGRVSYEDALLAGAIVRHVRGDSGMEDGDDEAEIAAGLYGWAAGDVDREATRGGPCQGQAPGERRSDGHGKAGLAVQAPGVHLPVERNLRGPERVLGLRPARRRTEAEHQGRLVE
ncbi:MAG: 2-phosphosulfolactate phosphatase [Planctomycetia bacterium]|nr:2-phosphosulfolactate phosphatase [Planctomycetia bacterium]